MIIMEKWLPVYLGYTNLADRQKDATYGHDFRYKTDLLSVKLDCNGMDNF